MTNTLRKKRRLSELATKVSVRESTDTALRLSLLYFLSGLPALLYQTVWQRLLVLHSGVGTASVSIIVAAYMLGLGLGSLLGAHFSRRMTPRKALTVFASLEMSIAVYAFLSPTLLYDILYQRLGWMYTNLWVAAGLHVATLVLPTTLMGMTLPLMTRALVREGSVASSSVSLLYGCNTLGAALGAALAPWLFMPFVGVRGVCSVGAAANFLVAVLALRMRDAVSDDRSSHISPQPSRSKVPTTNSSSSEPETSFVVWGALYFLSGLSAIGLEIVWFRILDVAVKSTSYTFGTVLATYLACMALGSVLGARKASNIVHPLSEFLSVQCWIVIAAAIPILVIFFAPTSLLDAVWVHTYWANADLLYPAWGRTGATLLLYIVFPLFMMAASTFLMGYSFAALQKGVQSDAAKSGYRVGILQAANILGCTLGSLLVGLWAINSIGTANTLKLIVALGSIFAVIGFATSRAKSRFGVAFVLILLVAAALPRGNDLWMRLHGQAADSPAKIVEDVTGVSVIAPEPGSPKWRVSANGKAQSDLPFGGFHSKLGALPAVMHAEPAEIAIIGLGSGDTAWAASCRAQTKVVTVFEICTSEAPALEALAANGGWQQLKAFLEDPRIVIDGRDARHVLMTEEKHYDIIEADAIRPKGAYAGYLYSIEFFQLCRNRLKPGGLMCTWVPTDGTYATFCEVFPYVIELDGGFMLIGSKDPLPDDLSECRARFRSEEIAKFLGPLVTSECLTSLEGATRTLRRFAIRMINTDLFPFDEFN